MIPTLFIPWYAGDLPPTPGTSSSLGGGGSNSLGDFPIGKVISFEIECHDADGEAADPDADPTFRVYDGTTTPHVASGTMAKFDGRTGFYQGTVDTDTEDFVRGHQYCIKIESVLGGKTSITHQNFTIEMAAEVNLKLLTELNLHNTATLEEQADSFLDRTSGVEASMTVRQALRIVLSALAGKISGAGTSTIRTRDMADSKDRIIATVDQRGNRTAVTRDGT